MRVAIALCLCAGFAATAKADGAAKMMRLLLNNSEFVFLGEIIESAKEGKPSEDGSQVRWLCTIRVIEGIKEVIKGELSLDRTFDVRVDLLSDHPYTPRKGDRRIFFLGEILPPELPFVHTADPTFGIQPASLSPELRRIFDDIQRHEKMFICDVQNASIDGLGGVANIGSASKAQFRIDGLDYDCTCALLLSSSPGVSMIAMIKLPEDTPDFVENRIVEGNTFELTERGRVVGNGVVKKVMSPK